MRAPLPRTKRLLAPESARPIPEFALLGLRIQAHVALAQGSGERVGRGHQNASSLAQARILLDRLLENVVAAGAHGRHIEVQMLLALALYAQGKTKQTLSTLGPILAQAEPEGYLRLFADEGEAMAHLLALIAPFTCASSDYFQRIQAAIASA